MQTINAKMQQAMDTSANWQASNPVLGPGQIAFEITADGSILQKAGNGTDAWNNLAYVKGQKGDTGVAGPPGPTASVNNILPDSNGNITLLISNSVSGTLATASWAGSSAPYTQTLTVTGLGATQNGSISVAQSATADQRAAASKAKLSVTGQAAGSLTITADGTKPTIDIPVTVILLG